MLNTMCRIILLDFVRHLNYKTKMFQKLDSAVARPPFEIISDLDEISVFCYPLPPFYLKMEAEFSFSYVLVL